MTNIPGDTSTTAVIGGSGTTASTLDFNGDGDWFRVELTAGLTYDFKLTGDGSANTLDNGVLRIRDASGNQIGISAGINNISSITASASGTYYISVEDSFISDNQAEGNYIITSRMDDTIANNTSTSASITGSGTTNGILGQSNDSDWYAVTLVAGRSYSFNLTGTGGIDSLDNGVMRLLDASGVQVGFSAGRDGFVTVTATTSGTYYINVEDSFESDRQAEGNYRVVSALSDTVVSNTETDQTLTQIARLRGSIDARGDSDWHEFATQAGRTYTITLAGDGAAAALAGKRLFVRDASGDVIDAAGVSTAGEKAVVTFTAETSGPVYLDVQGNGFNTGKFLLSAISDAPVLTGNASANYLAGGANATRISGLAGADTILGNGGKDRLDGGVGNDLLTGGGDKDVFIFANNGDKDRILDFRNNFDTIRLDDNLGINTIRQALARADQVGKNVVFDFGQGDTLTILDIRKAALADDLLIG